MQSSLSQTWEHFKRTPETNATKPLLKHARFVFPASSWLILKIRGESLMCLWHLTSGAKLLTTTALVWCLLCVLEATKRVRTQYNWSNQLFHPVASSQLPVALPPRRGRWWAGGGRWVWSPEWQKQAVYFFFSDSRISAQGAVPQTYFKNENDHLHVIARATLTFNLHYQSMQSIQISLIWTEKRRETSEIWFCEAAA